MFTWLLNAESGSWSAPRTRRLLAYLVIAVLMLGGNAIADDVSGSVPAGAPANRAPVLVAGKTSPSPQTSPGVVQNLAVDSLGSVLANITTSGLSNLLTTDLDSNGSTNVTTGAGVALLVPAAGGAATVGGTANGVYVQGKDATDDAVSVNPLLAGARTWGVSGLPPSVSANGDAVPILSDGFGRLRIIAEGVAAHDSAISQAPVRIAGRARAINSPLSAVSGDDVCDLITTIDGLLRVAGDASARTTGTDSYCTPSFAGGSSEVTVKASTGNVYDLHVANPNTTDVYLLLFDASNPTPGTTAPTRSFCVPGGSGASNCGIYDLTLNPPIMFSTAITATVVTAANGSTAPSSAVDLNIGYK